MSRPIPAPFFEMEQQFAHRDLVIKVKYGDTLRRISASVHGNLMDHNMSKLRAKIIDLFKFSNDADLILSYIDEDGDIVTLDNDDELLDAVIGQRLNPLRINVQLKSTVGSDAKSESSSQAKFPQSDTLPTVDEPLKSIPEPFINVLANLFNVAQNVVSSSPAFEVVKSEPFRSAMESLSKDVKKAASFSPALTQVVDQFSKLGLSNPSKTSEPTGDSLGGASGASTHLMDLNVVDEPIASTEPIVEATELSGNTTGSVDPVPKQSGGDVASSATLNTDAPRNATASLYPLEDLLDSIWAANKCSGKDKDVGSSKLDGKFVSATSAASSSANQDTHNSDNFWAHVQTFPAYIDNPANTTNEDSSIKQSQNEARPSFPSQTGFSCHSDIPIGRQVGLPDFLHAPPMCPYLIRSHIYNENTPSSIKQSQNEARASFPSQTGFSCHPDIPIGRPVGLPDFFHAPPMRPYTPRTFHRGVQCDGCGMHPIVGPRFKSNVKEDYDLCNICFTQMGNENDYTKIERASHQAPRLIKQLHNHHSRPLIPPPKALLRRCGVRPPREKLESRFIQDVTVLDGTVMPPLTHFTKIWRLRNNGTVAWPFGTQLVWVGGDQFGDRVSVDLEIPESGFPVDKELDIAVDFTAPSRVGRYVSYWRMASPSGQKFGQRVWVIIQVEYSQPNSASGSFYPDLNLNLPPESSSRNGSVIIDVNAEPLDAGFPEINVMVTTEELVTPEVVDVPKQLVEQQPPAKVVGNLLDANDEASKSTTAAPVVSPSASDSLIDLSVTPSTVDPSTVEETLLKELEEMGFKQIDLNKEILRLNEYDLEQSVVDLCGFSEWDPLLSELNEMGFTNKELNKKLLMKNGGSIKRVVLDLIAGKMD